MSKLSDVWGAKEELPVVTTLDLLKDINEWIDEVTLERQQISNRVGMSVVEFEQVQEYKVGYFEQNQAMLDTLELFHRNVKALREGRAPSFNTDPQVRNERINAGMRARGYKK